MAEPGFDPRRLSAGSLGLLGTGIVLLVDLFFSWERFGDVTVKGYSGVGWLLFLLVLGLLAWEGALAAGVEVRTGTISPALISAGIAGAVVLVGLIRFLVALTRDVFSPAFGSWIGLIVVAAMAYAGWLRWGEAQTGAGPSGPPGP